MFVLRTERPTRSISGVNESVSMGIARNSDVRRLLVITYHFPPDGAVGGQRWAGLAKYLARLGWEVHVVTASAAGAQEETPGVHRHFRPGRRTLNDVYNAAAARFRQRSSRDRQPVPENPDRPRPFSPLRPVAALRRILGSSMGLPDCGRGWVGRAAFAARALLRERKFDLVITSGPPHSAHFAGLLATIDQDMEFWIDMRDPWSQAHAMNAPEDWLVRAERFLLRRLERLVFSRASRVIANTREFASALRLAEPDLDVVCFPNGIDLEHTPSRDVGAVEPSSIAHVGTLYAGRNLSAVCAAMGRLLSDRPEAAAILRLNVAGPIEPPHRRRMDEDIAAAGLESVVKVHGVLPRAQALALLNRSHLALVLAQDQPMQVPAKLYESVGLGVPTLVIAEETSAAACEARRIGAMTLDGSDVEGMRILLEDMLAGRMPTTIASRTPVSYEDLGIRMDRLLREAVERRRAGTMREPYTPAIAASEELHGGMGLE
jgi:glycosyltransferase involved in cell wall biosynthesis